MFLQLISLVLYQQSFIVQKNETEFNIPCNFGFESGGSFNVEINNYYDDSLIYILAPQDEFNKYSDLDYIQNPWDLNFSYVYQIKTIEGKGQISGNIQKQGTYKSKIITGSYSNNFINYQIIIRYQNPNSYLSSNFISYLSSLPIYLNISSFFYIIWVIYLKLYNQSTNKHQIKLTFCFQVYIIKKVLHYLCLKKASDFDEIEDYYYLKIIFQSIQLPFYLIFVQWYFDFTIDFLPNITFLSLLCTISTIVLDCFMFFCYFFIFHLFFNVHLVIVAFEFVCAIEFIAYFVYYKFLVSRKKTVYLCKKTQNHFLLFSLVNLIVSDSSDKILFSNWPYFCLLIKDYLNLIILICLGLVCLFRKESTNNDVDENDEDLVLL